MSRRQSPTMSNMYYENERLQTFKNWPLNEDGNCNSTKVAEAGWYSCCNDKFPDWVQCFFCDKQLDGWEPGDDPWEEHRKHSPECMFIKLGKKEADITVREHLKLCFEVDKKHLIAKANELKQQQTKEKNRIMKKFKHILKKK